MNLEFLSDGDKTTIQAEGEKLISDLAHEADIFLNMRCGGKGSCGGCSVHLDQGRFLIGKREVHVRAGKGRKALSCQTRVLGGEPRISIPPSSRIELSGKISTDFSIKDFHNDTQTKKFFIQVPEATLENPLSDRQRVEQQLARHTDLKNIYMPLDALKKLPEAISEGNRHITVTIGRIRNYWFIINIEAGDTTHTHLAVAVDIGTTTVIAILIDLSQGAIIARASRYNQQITIADDVASRISISRSRGEVRRLQNLVVKDTINPIIEELCGNTGFTPQQINRMAVSANTVMTHLFLGLTPESIGRIPFQPVTCDPGEYLAGDIGVSINAHGIVDMIPSIAGYIGGDITSDIYVARLDQQKGLSILVDIGTNGEMIMSEDGHMVACATPAGPAFEGAGLNNGCRASAGAIESIQFGADLDMSILVIGDHPPRGICGSGIIDFIACALRCGLVNFSGRFDIDRLQSAGRYQALPHADNTIHACIVAKAGDPGVSQDILVSEDDISRILQAKAAIYSGIKTLLETRSKNFGDIQRLVLAGGFAKHIDLHNAITMGLIPDLPREKIDVVGNGSLAGSFLALVEPEALKKMRDLSRIPGVVELNLEDSFQKNYVDALFLPNMNTDEFPSLNLQQPL